MTSTFSWQNSIRLCPASFRTLRPNLPVTLGVSWLPTSAFQSLIMKWRFFFGVSSKRSCKAKLSLAYLKSAQDLYFIKIWRNWGSFCVCASACSLISDSLWPHGLACQASLSIEFSRQEYRSRCPFLLQGIFPAQVSNPHLLSLLQRQMSFSGAEPTEKL